MKTDRELLEETLKAFVRETGEETELILIGGLAVQYYGIQGRPTYDIDAEIIKGDLYRLYRFLASKGIPADLSENISGWSVIGMPEGYRDRTYTVFEDRKLKVKLLNPYDFIVAKLRRGTWEDVEDAVAVFKKFNLSVQKLDRYVESAIENSVKDTSILAFRKRYDKFKEIL
ncbi:MAG: hypothetical protein GXN94_05920, partial [Aquificae bacterium]|nr:hypothetical protein [Aquificota bacterium]